MDFVGYEYSDDTLPSPQPTLSLPLKANIEQLSLKLTTFNNIRNLLKTQPNEESTTVDDAAVLAAKYAQLSLALLQQAEPREAATAPDPTAARTSALSKRLARALNPDLADGAMRDLFTRFEAKQPDVAAMIELGVAGSMARKSLRSQVETDLIRGHAAVLADYAKPIKHLKYLAERVAAVELLVRETNALLLRDHAQAAGLTASVGALAQQKRALQLKKGLLVSFRNKFTLNEYEQYVLEQGDISADYFAALRRAEDINAACEILLALDNPELGRRVLAQNNDLLARAAARIRAFCNRALANMYLLHNRDRLALLHLCLAYLQSKPDQLVAVVDAFVDARAAALADEFALQASGHGADAAPALDSRPVFYSLHDPVRFIADLLAYVHSLVVNESETVGGLFETDVDAIVERILHSLARPIRLHIDQLVLKEMRLSTLNQMLTHLQLYHMMFAKLPHGAGVCATLADTIRLAQDRIVSVVSNRLVLVSNSNLAQIDLSADLQPPEWIIDFYADLLPVLDAAAGETVFGLAPDEHAKFLALIVDEPIAIFSGHLAALQKTLNLRDVIIFKLNFLDLVLTKIMPIGLLSDKVLDLNHTITDLASELKAMQLQVLLKDCTLTDFYNVMNMICPMEDDLFEPSIYQAITENKLFTRENIVAADATIQAVLPPALLDIQLALMKLNSPMTVNDIITLSLVEFAKFYKLFAAVVEEFLGERLFTWTDADVATLLGVEHYS